MNSSDEPEPTRCFEFPAQRTTAQPALALAPQLIRRQRRILADWREVETFLDVIPAALARSPYSVCLLSDRAIRRYNEQFRKKDEATDVLSFPMGRGANGESEYLGDILISVEMAQRNASRFGVRL